MEVAPSARYPELLDLRQLRADHLSDLLEEEIGAWRETLNWDFNKSAALVRRFVDLRALSGYALFMEGEAAGYAYYVVEDHKGLVGDVYVRKRFRTHEYEMRLLEAVLDGLIGTPGVKRIESQLMMLDASPARVIPASRFLQGVERSFMVLHHAGLPELPARPVRRKIYVEHWDETHQEAAAQLIAAAYVGHMDGNINDQYRSAAGTRRFLYNIVQYPGCGSFFRPASYAAFDISTGRMQGISLASLVSARAGHITQLCVSPEARGNGIGYELMRQSVEQLRRAGTERISLTVTSANRDAITLYERAGFVTERRFWAYSWEGF